MNESIKVYKNPQVAFQGAELVIGLVSAVGTNLTFLTQTLEDSLRRRAREVTHIKVSQSILAGLFQDNGQDITEYERIRNFMSYGNQARKVSGDNGILATGIASVIQELRVKDGEEPKHTKNGSYIVDSLKHPEEVARLRSIYANGFYLIGAYSNPESRKANLEAKSMSSEDADRLIVVDLDENIGHGQHTSDTFHLSDFFVNVGSDHESLKREIDRIVDILFADPYLTPHFDEYAMHMAFISSLRSADLSRQVGAVIANDEEEILSMGANDCPKFGGGLYWPEFDSDLLKYVDRENGRDYMRGVDSNRDELNQLINTIVDDLDIEDVEEQARIKTQLWKSKLTDITEYGRVVHAEMEALLFCARNGISTRGCTLYCTTFPCHNCAKHIIASGIRRVVYVEPYPKSKAEKFHSDAIEHQAKKPSAKKVQFDSFVGVGPRKFLDLFSMKLGDGRPIKRKDSDGKVLPKSEQDRSLRVKMLPYSYLDLETAADIDYKLFRDKLDKEGTVT